MTTESLIQKTIDARGSTLNRQRRIKKWRDVSHGFGMNEVTKDVAVKADEASINQHLRTLFVLEKYDKLFHPEIHVGIPSLLFENWSPQIQKLAEDKIETAVIQWEPRITLISTHLSFNDEGNALTVTLIYRMKDNPGEIEFKTVLRRLR